MGWNEDLARWQQDHPGGTASDFANAIRNTQGGQSNSLAEDQFNQQFGLSQESLNLAREQFAYQKQKDAERLANIQSSMASIKDVFGGRQPVYDALQGESFKLNERRLNELQTDAGRNLNFSLARAGTTGGSVEVDKNKELAEKMGLGIGQAEIFAQGQADKLKAQDDALKSSLQGLAASGAVGGPSMAGTARSATQGRYGTPQYTQGIENTFGGLSSNIGGAAKGSRRSMGGF